MDCNWRNKSTYTYIFRHDVDSYKGDSGAPVYTTSDGVVWGIHSRGTYLLVFNNTAVRITEGLYNVMQEKYEEGMDRYY